MSNLINEAKAYKCPICNKWYLYRDVAEKCCETRKKVCEDCGVELNIKTYYTVCDSCREKRRYNRCKKMTIEEYENEFPGNMIVDINDNYYASVEDMLEDYYSNEYDIPRYVYGTEKIYATVDIESAVERALEDAYEDAEFGNLDELYDFVNAWNERNKLTMFEETDIVIDIPEEMRQKYIS